MRFNVDPPSERESKLARLAPPPRWMHLLQLEKDESAISLRFSLPSTFPQNCIPGTYQSQDVSQCPRLLVLSQEIKMLFCISCNLECIPHGVLVPQFSSVERTNKEKQPISYRGAISQLPLRVR